MKKFLIIILLLFFCISCVSASEDTNILNNQPDTTAIHVNSTKTLDGNGSSWDEAFNGSNSWNEIHYDKDNNRIDNCIVYLANGKYSQNTPINYNNCTFIGQGKDTVISFYADNAYSNAKCVFINITFVKKVNIEDDSVYTVNLRANYDFIDCTFVDLPVSKMGWPGSTQATFKNCVFSNANQTSLITNNYYGNLKFDSCIFENITADAIVFNDVSSCTLLDNCIFKNITVKGILRSNNGQLYGSRIKNATYDTFMLNKSPISSPYYFNSTENLEIYVNSSCEVSGDGSSYVNAIKSLVVYDNLVVHLAEGNYNIPDKNLNITYIGQGSQTIITSFNLGNSGYLVRDNLVTIINATFKPPIQIITISDSNYNSIQFYYNIKVDSMTFNFIGCDFINSTFISRVYNRQTPDKDGRTQGCVINFDNCRFRDYNGTYLINNWEYSKFIFNNCTFDNITADAIVDSYGGQIGTNGVSDGVYINNSQFKNCSFNGVVKSRVDGGYYVISNCSFDFELVNVTSKISPFYVNTTDRILVKTNLNVISVNNSLIIILSDVNGSGIYDAELSINVNNNTFYDYTDEEGIIVLNNLSDEYNFTIIYPGDYNYASSSVVKFFNFKKVIRSIISASNVSTVYNIAKNLVITLKDVNGYVLVNKKVSVNVGSISKILTTNRNGQASINIASLNPKTYIAFVLFSGDGDYSSSSSSSKVVVSKITPSLSFKKASFKVKTKVKKYYVTFKVLKNVKVSLKVKGKTYFSKTNSKGKATFKITKLNKKGTYKAKIIFKGNSFYNSISRFVRVVIK